MRFTQYFDYYAGGHDVEYVTMRPSESRNISIVIFNLGEAAQFALSVWTSITDNDIFHYDLSATTVNLQQDSSMEIYIKIYFSSNIADGLEITFTVLAESMRNNDVSDFVTISVLTTTRPPPEFTENVSTYTIIESVQIREVS